MKSIRRVCRKCGVEQPIEQFHHYAPAVAKKHRWTCKSCANKTLRGRHRIRNADSAYHATELAKARKVYRGQRLAVIQKYGRICECCGESEPLFLNIDHIKGDGQVHRKSLGVHGITPFLYRMSRQPEYRLLCYNCNCGRQLNGGICPHEMTKPTAAALRGAMLRLVS